MPELDLILLGIRIRNVRKECGLTQQELADQTGLSVKTIQDAEKGRKNLSYETLTRLMDRLGMSPDTVFLSRDTIPTKEMQHLLEDFQSCDPRGQKILFKTIRFLAEQLRTPQDEEEAK